MSCVAIQRTPCSRHPQAARSLSSYDYAQSLLERMYKALEMQTEQLKKMQEEVQQSRVLSALGEMAATVGKGTAFCMQIPA